MSGPRDGNHHGMEEGMESLVISPIFSDVYGVSCVFFSPPWTTPGVKRVPSETRLAFGTQKCGIAEVTETNGGEKYGNPLKLSLIQV